MKKIRLFSIVFSLVILLTSFHFVWSQEKKIPQENNAMLTQNSTQTILAAINGLKEENTTRQSQRNLDRSIGILNIVATSMGVLVGLLTLILMIAAACGFLQFRRWKNVIKEAGQDVEAIRTMRSRAEKAVEFSRKEIGEPIPISSAEKPSEKIKENLNELSNRLAWLEMFGGTLKVEDYISRGVDLFYKQKYDLALKAFDKAIELEPDNTDAWYSKGVALGRLELNEEALKAFDKAIELKPDVTYIWDGKGVALFNLKRFEEGLKAYEKAIELKPSNANAWSNKGATLLRLKQPDEAIKACDKAIELKPSSANAWSNKGAALLRLKQPDEAIKACDKAIELKPDYATAWYNKACAYSQKNNKPIALENLSKAINLDVKYKEEAKKDEDFKNLWDDENFKKIVS